MSVIQTIGGVLTFSWLLISYQVGSYLASRIFGYRVLRVSVGFGPALFRFTIGNTVFQLALIPFLGYVQIDGMNPLEQADPRDRGSFANGSLFGRVMTVLGGPLGILIPALVLFAVASMVGQQVAEGPFGVVAARGTTESTLERGDRVLAINGAPVATTLAAAERLSSAAGKEIALTIEHRGRKREVKLRPQEIGDDQGRYGITLGRTSIERTASARQAWGLALRQMRFSITSVFAGVVTLVSGADAGGGPLTGQSFAKGEQPGKAVLPFVGILATYLGFFNLLPFPGLNGGRLVFLAYETLSRRKPNARVELGVHFFGMILLLGTTAFVSMFDVFNGKAASDKLAPPPAAVQAGKLRDQIDRFRSAKRIYERWGLSEPRLSI